MLSRIPSEQHRGDDLARLHSVVQIKPSMAWAGMYAYAAVLHLAAFTRIRTHRSLRRAAADTHQIYLAGFERIEDANTYGVDSRARVVS